MQLQHVSGFKLRRPVFCCAIVEKMIVVYVTHVHSYHSLPFIGYLGTEMAGFNCLQVILRATLADGVPIGFIMQGAFYFGGVFICPVAQHQRIFLYRRFLFFMDDKRTIQAALLLRHGVRMVPVSAILYKREFKKMRFRRA